jgi:hypothetical protein
VEFQGEVNEKEQRAEQVALLAIGSWRGAGREPPRRRVCSWARSRWGYRLAPRKGRKELMSLVRRSIAVALVLGLGAATAAACIHGSSREGKPFKGRVLAAGYEGIVFHADGREELILNVVASIEGDPKEAGAIGWVLALPTVPDRYDASLTPQVFADASELMHSLSHPAKSHGGGGPLTFGGPSKGGARAPAIKVKKILVGPYTVHQIEVLGAGAVTALNEWFKKNGFQERDPKSMAFFVKRGYTFLCMRVKPGASQSKGFSKRANLPPLRVSFAAAKPFFPLKFSSHAGTFPLSLYLLSEHPLDWEASGKTLQRLGFASTVRFATATRRNYEIGPSSLGGQLYQVYDKALKEGFPKAKRLYFNLLEARKINTRKNPISAWEDDVWFELNTSARRSEVRKTIRAMLGQKSLSENHVASMRKLGQAAVSGLREVLATSSNESARICAGWLLLKLDAHNRALCVRLLKSKNGPALDAVLGAMLLSAGDKSGFKPLFKGLSSASGATPLSWRQGKPRVRDFCRGALAHFTGLSFRKTSQWEDWYLRRRKKLRWDPAKHLFR